MKRLIATVTLAMGLSAGRPMQAQLFTPESFSGAALGGITGALVGGRHAGEAAAIGAGSGFLLGTLIHETRREPYACYGPYASGYYSPNYYPYYYRPGHVYAARPPAPAYYADPRPAVSQPPAVTQVQTAPADPPTQTTLRSQSPTSTMTSANNLFGR